MRTVNLGILLILTALGCLITVGCGTSSAAPRAAVPQRYHDGEHWVEFAVALDRLHLERSASASGPARVEVYMLRRPVASVADLEAVARQIQDAQADIRQVTVYVRSLEAPASEPQRLTRQVAVRGGPGQDLPALAAQHGMRMVERVDYSPDTMIAEATAPSVLAALESAESLRKVPGVVFAIPLIERQQLPRHR